MSAAPIPCRWCGRNCQPCRSGSPRVFCTSGCRTAFHTAARRRAEKAFASGMLTIADLRNGNPAAYTLRVDSNPHYPVQNGDAARLDALVDAIFDKLADDELKSLSEVVWELIILIDKLGGG